MKDITLEECFRVLELKNGDSFEAARKAFKQKMHRCHPDRYPNDVHAQKKATEQFMHVKRCFRQLEEHYKLFGDMPVLDSPEHFYVDDEPQEQPSSSQTRSSNTSTSATMSLRERGKEREKERERAALFKAAHFENSSDPEETIGKSSKRQASAGELGLIILIIAVIGYFVISPPSSDWHDDVDLSDYPAQAPKPLTNRSDELHAEETKARALLSTTEKQLLDTLREDTFTFGSSAKDVVAIHGTPDESQNNTWLYKKSKVMFKDGRVVDWQSHSTFPLATRLK